MSKLKLLHATGVWLCCWNSPRDFELPVLSKLAHRLCSLLLELITFYFTLILYWESRDIFYIFGNQSQKLVPDYCLSKVELSIFYGKSLCRSQLFLPPQVFVAWLLSKTWYVSTSSKSSLSYTELGFVGILVGILVGWFWIELGFLRYRYLKQSYLNQGFLESVVMFMFIPFWTTGILIFELL